MKRRGSRSVWRALQLGQFALIFLGNTGAVVALIMSEHTHSWFSQFLVRVGLSKGWYETPWGSWSGFIGTAIVSGLVLVPIQLLLVRLGWRIVRRGFRPGARFFIRAWVTAALWSGPILYSAVVLLDCSLHLVLLNRRIISGTFDVPAYLLYSVLAAPFIGLRVMRRRAGSVFRRCPNCGYNLTGNVSGVCPECGEAV
jgi:hypothetical protein